MRKRKKIINILLHLTIFYIQIVIELIFFRSHRIIEIIICSQFDRVVIISWTLSMHMFFLCIAEKIIVCFDQENKSLQMNQNMKLNYQRKCYNKRLQQASQRKSCGTHVRERYAPRTRYNKLCSVHFSINSKLIFFHFFNVLTEYGVRCFYCNLHAHLSVNTTICACIFNSRSLSTWICFYCKFLYIFFLNIIQ